MKKKEITIELGDTFWLGIPFAGAVFTGNWFPFIVVVLIRFLIYIHGRDKT